MKSLNVSRLRCKKLPGGTGSSRGSIFRLKVLGARKVEIGDAIDASNNALLDTDDKIEKAKEMIKRTNLLLSKA